MENLGRLDPPGLVVPEGGTATSSIWERPLVAGELPGLWLRSEPPHSRALESRAQPLQGLILTPTSLGQLLSILVAELGSAGVLRVSRVSGSPSNRTAADEQDPVMTASEVLSRMHAGGPAASLPATGCPRSTDAETEAARLRSIPRWPSEGRGWGLTQAPNCRMQALLSHLQDP